MDMFLTGYLCLGAIVAFIAFIIKMFYNNSSSADILQAVSCGTLIGFVICIITGMNVIVKKADYEKINNAVDNDNNCWVINGNRICGAYTFEDDKTKIEVTEDGKTHITIK